MRGLQLILDTNLLVLFVVGTASRKYIGSHKRLKQFSEQDYDLLLQAIGAASEILVTPNTLAETSNLAKNISEPAKSEVMSVLGQIISESPEIYVRSADAVQNREYIRLGLTDSALISASTENTVLLTTDLGLYLALLDRGMNAENFNHMRDASYT